jgi:hypothetical protein
MDAGKPRAKTLADQDIVTRTPWDRRRLMRAGAAAVLATAVVAPPAAAQGVSDRDAGAGADPPGRGRHPRTGVTDSDGGASADPINGGRGGGRPTRPQTGLTDRDAGAGADPPGGGRGGAGSRNAGVTDSDAGAGADPPGRGRGTNRGPVTGRNDRDYYERPWNADRHANEESRVSDNDGGPNRDPQGEGRGTAAWARRHQQGPSGGRPPSNTRPGRRYDNDSRDAQLPGDLADALDGRNDAARYVTDLADVRLGSRGDAAQARVRMGK